jgi:type I restriction enzyme S subunit
MTPEVRDRIDQIRQGIVPEGYKKTESGIIPNEWRVEQVSKCIEEYKFFSNDISHIPVYSSSRKGLVPQSDYYNQREAVETNLGYKVVPQGYVTYRHMSDDDVFHFNINKTGENVLVSSEYPVFTSSDNCDLSFLISVLNNTARFRYFCKMQKLGGTRTRLYLDNLKRYALALPPFDEQKKIAEILSTQDKAIELQGRKIEELKRFKKGCLEKMFPRKGQKVPEKRFPGFTDDWEQRKLGGVTTSYSGGTPTVGVKEYYDGQIPFIRSAEINSESTELFISEKGLNVSSARLVSKGDILYALYGATSGEVGRARLEGAINQAILAIKPMDNYDAEYLSQWLRKSKQNIVETYLQGGQGNLSGAIVKELIVDFPSYNEQQIIGQYFANLDRLITLHQRKLEEMKNQKKALMQLLLTGIVKTKGEVR